MKKLILISLVIFFAICSKSWSNELVGKSLVCSLIVKKSILYPCPHHLCEGRKIKWFIGFGPKNQAIKGYLWFYNGEVREKLVDNYNYSTTLDFISMSHLQYYNDGKYLGTTNININRKTLEMTYTFFAALALSDVLIYKGFCEVMNSTDELEDRIENEKQRILNKQKENKL